MNLEFAEDLKEGLSQEQKFLKSKYFYDAEGDKIFIEIMNMPEYYLTRAEYQIFEKRSADIIDTFKVSKEVKFDLVELGSGDGTKTKMLLKELTNQGYNFNYLPIDISEDSLQNLKADLSNEFPDLTVLTKQGDYFDVLKAIKAREAKKVVLFLGSNLGNMEDEDASDFLYKLDGSLNVNDVLLLGLDIIKAASVVLPAYDDKSGITARFNLNLLTRINREFDADFIVNQFSHKAEYTEDEGVARSFIISKVDQKVSIKSLDMEISFKENERISMEMSRKYNDEILSNLIRNTGFKVVDKLMDDKSLYADYILKK
ncbi:L-histidine N(alpha)-methyltransferase [Saprospiraceae bacterium]|nr:L-histidine N(alpha)-methyltransferase [Saprospiraceae bacterium]